MEALYLWSNDCLLCSLIEMSICAMILIFQCSAESYVNQLLILIKKRKFRSILHVTEVKQLPR